MVRLFLPLFALSLSACGPAEAELEDLGEDTDTPTPETTPIPEPPTIALSGALTIPEDVVMPAGEVTVVALLLDEDFGFGEVQASVALGAVVPGGSVPYTLELPEEPADALYFQDTDNPEMEVAAFVIGAYMDADADGLPGPDDHYVGLAFESLVAHVRGTLPAEAIEDGVASGWNHVVGEDASLPFTDALSGLDIEATLLEVERSAGLAFEVLAATDGGPPGTVRVDLYSSNGYFGTEPAEPTLASVEIARSGGGEEGSLPDSLPAPPDDHYSVDLGDGPQVGIEIALYSALSYVDEDGDGVWSGDFYDEAVLASSDAVAAEDHVLVMHVRATGFEAAFLGHLIGGMGWTLLREGADPEAEPIRVSWADGVLLDDQW